MCDRAKQLMNHRNLEQALVLLDRAVDLDSSSIRCLLMRSELKFRMNKFHGAMRDAQNALSQSPNNVKALQLIGRCYRAMGEPQLALQTYEKAIKLDPKDSYSQFICANLFFGDRKYAEAEPYYKKAQALNPDHFLYLVNHAENLRYLHKYDEAEKLCDRALKVKPNFHMAYNIKSIVAYQRGNKKMAIKLLEKAIECNPLDPTLLFNLACMKEENGDRQGAINTLTDALKLNPNHASALNNRGNLYGLQGDYTRARVDLDQAIRLEPHNVRAILNRARLFAQMGQVEESVADYEQAQKIMSQYAQGNGKAKTSRPSAKEFDDIIDGYTRLISINPKDSSSRYNRGCAYFCLGNYAEAGNDFEKFFELKKTQKNSAIFAAIFHHLSCSLSGNVSQKNKLLNQCDSIMDATGWPEPLILYLRGKKSEAQLLKTTKGTGQNTSCHFVIGIKQIADGQKAAAEENLKWVTTRGDPSMDEFMMSVCQLNKPVRAKPADMLTGTVRSQFRSR